VLLLLPKACLIQGLRLTEQNIVVQNWLLIPCETCSIVVGMLGLSLSNVSQDCDGLLA
jgi:hypothetical protein